MSGISEKQELLKKEGFVYISKREIYFNRSKKKIIAEEDLEDNSIDRLKEAILEVNANNEWQFYFIWEPSSKLKEEILSEIGS